MYYLTEAGRLLLERPIVGDPGTPRAGQVIRTRMNPVVHRAIIKDRHNPQWLKAFAAAEKVRKKLEKGKENVPFSQAQKLIGRAYWSMGKKGRGGRHGNVFPGFTRDIIEPMDNQSSQEQG